MSVFRFCSLLQGFPQLENMKNGNCETEKKKFCQNHSQNTKKITKEEKKKTKEPAVTPSKNLQKNDPSAEP